MSQQNQSQFSKFLDATKSFTRKTTISVQNDILRDKIRLIQREFGANVYNLFEENKTEEISSKFQQTKEKIDVIMKEIAKNKLELDQIENIKPQPTPVKMDSVTTETETEDVTEVDDQDHRPVLTENQNQTTQN